MAVHLVPLLLTLSAASLVAQQKPTILSPSEVPYEGKGIPTAWVYRAQDGSSADAFIRWPAGVMEGGKAEPVSTHPFAVRIAVVQGTVLFQFAGEKLRELQPGSYILAPAGAKHVLGCKAGGIECVMFAVFAPDPERPK